jgi:tRNA G18 (ribose-2'-O)-methylase SpoU
LNDLEASGASDPDKARMARSEHVVSQRQRVLILVLEDIYDASNIGAALRSGNTFGVPTVYITSAECDPIQLRRRSSSANRWVRTQMFRSTSVESLQQSAPERLKVDKRQLRSQDLWFFV